MMSTTDPVTPQTDATYFRVGVNALIFNEAQEVLLALRRDIGWWNLPGGGMELGETVTASLVREVLEETGLEVSVERPVGIYSKPQKREVVLAFRCHITGGAMRPTAESSECRFFAPNNLPSNLLPNHRQRVEDAMLNLPQAVIRDQLSRTEDDQRFFDAE